ncbi:hypothetical protein ACFFN3_21385, partial [Leifsonia shinshuensis]
LARPEAEASPAAGELAGLARPDGEASASAPAALRSAVAAPLPTAAAEAAEMARLIEKVEADRPTEPAVSAA